MNKEIKIYGTIGCGDTTAIGIIRQIDKAIGEGAKSITFKMHSEGGSVLDGGAIFNVINGCKIPTKIVIEGIAASMASIIILAADEVEICENAFIMVHRPSMTESGDYDALTQGVKVLKAIENNFLNAYSEKTGLSTDRIKSMWLDGKDHWINADEAVKLGLANRKIKPIAKGININSVTKEIKAVYNKFAAKLNISNNINMKEEIIKRFDLKGLDADSTDIEVLDALEKLFKSLKEGKEQETEKAVEAVVNSAIRSGKILASVKDTYINIGKTSGIASLNAVFETIPKPIDIASLIKPEAKIGSLDDNSDIKNNVSKWGLDEYRKYNPKALKDNPQLYKELYEREYGQNK